MGCVSNPHCTDAEPSLFCTCGAKSSRSHTPSRSFLASTVTQKQEKKSLNSSCFEECLLWKHIPLCINPLTAKHDKFCSSINIYFTSSNRSSRSLLRRDSVSSRCGSRAMAAAQASPLDVVRLPEQENLPNLQAHARRLTTTVVGTG